jgi:hypothetical protein
VLWLTFRQFRVQAIVAAGLLAALAVVVVIDGSQLLHDYHVAAGTCAGSQDCAGALNRFSAKYSALGHWLSGVVIVVPALVGVFWGAPLVARELEAGTFRLAWTQSISRARWTLCKLGLLGLAAMVVAGLCSLLVTWWSSPLDLVAGQGPFANFDTRGLVPIAYATCAFALGVAAGALIRHTVAAMGATLVVFAGIRVAITEWVRPHLMAPLTSRSPFTIATPRRISIGTHLPQGAWVVTESIVNRAGQTVLNGSGFLANPATAVGPNGVNLPGVGSCPNLRPAADQVGNLQVAAGLMVRCVNQLHLSNVVTYQPASRYWPFQIYESLIFFVLAAAIGGFTVWWVRRIN